MELRSRVRHRLSADAVFTWEGPCNKRLVAEGVTRDISVAGAFIFTRTCPPVGATLELEIFLSPTAGDRAPTVLIKTEAKVIRVEHSATVEGFAVVGRDFTLLFDYKAKNGFGVSGKPEKFAGALLPGIGFARIV
jgi:PilZ domain